MPDSSLLELWESGEAGHATGPEQAQNSVFIVEGLACGKSSVGTGVLIEEGILTNAHVIAGTEKLEVIDFNGNRSTTYPINTDFETDLALLKDPNLAISPLQIAAPKENQKGSIWDNNPGTQKIKKLGTPDPRGYPLWGAYW